MQPVFTTSSAKTVASTKGHGFARRARPPLLGRGAARPEPMMMLSNSCHDVPVFCFCRAFLFIPMEPL